MKFSLIRLIDKSEFKIQLLTSSDIAKMLSTEEYCKYPNEYWDDCYFKDDECIVQVPNAGFSFNKDYVEVFFKRVAFLINQYKEFIFFELVDKFDIATIFTNSPGMPECIENRINVDIFKFQDGRILVCDKYSRSGEIFMSYSDFSSLDPKYYL